MKQILDELSRLEKSANSLMNVDFADTPKTHSTQIGQETCDQFESVLQFASVKYKKRRIAFRPREQTESKKRGGSTSPKKKPRPTRVIEVADLTTCPRCACKSLRQKKEVSRFITDLHLTKNGMRKSVTRYIGFQKYCPGCSKVLTPPEILKFGPNQFYAHGFKAWIVYQRVGLRLPLMSIVESAREHFNEKIASARVPYFMKNFADYHASTEENILLSLMKSPFIHADETKFNIGGAHWYVWVFTDGGNVIFKLTETREPKIAHDLLSNYDGVLITDFYSGYDSIPCKHQKCWVHLIRHLNTDLRNNPFDEEYEEFVIEVRNLIIPIMETIQKYGLKKRNLNKFRRKVARFYATVIDGRRYRSNLVLKYQQRFVKYPSLFTFITQDGIPWHNNTAENAIRQVAVLRDVSHSSFQEKPTHHYLRLLSIRQTCRFQGKSFFQFLFSGETDVDSFKRYKR